MKGDNLTFSEFFNSKRLSMGLTLRRFCANKGYDVAYISRLENGLMAPPEDPEKLKALAFALELEESSIDWVTFFDLAATVKGKLPEDLKRDTRIMTVLPAFYRTIRKKDIAKTDIDKLIKLLKGNGGSGDENESQNTIPEPKGNRT